MQSNSSFDQKLDIDRFNQIYQGPSISKLILSHDQIILLMEHKIIFDSQQYYENPRTTIIAETQDCQVIELQVKLSYFTFKLLAYNSTKNDGANITGTFLNNGGQGSIYSFFGYDFIQKEYNPFVVKRCNYQEGNCKQNIYQYCVTKLFSILKIGCQIKDIFGFDFITYPDNSVQFALQWALPIPLGSQQHLKSLQKSSLQLFRKLKLYHLDIKTQNIMYSETLGKLVLIDWGCSISQWRYNHNNNFYQKDQNSWNRVIDEYQTFFSDEEQSKLLNNKIIQIIKKTHDFLDQIQIDKIKQFYDPYKFIQSKIQVFCYDDAGEQQQDQSKGQTNVYINFDNCEESIWSSDSNKYSAKSHFLLEGEDHPLPQFKPNQTVLKIWNHANKLHLNNLQTRNKRQYQYFSSVSIKYQIYQDISNINLSSILRNLDQKNCFQILSYILKLKWNSYFTNVFNSHIQPFFYDKIQKKSNNATSLNFYFPSSGFSSLLYKDQFYKEEDQQWEELFKMFIDKIIKLNKNQKRRRYDDKQKILNRFSFCLNVKLCFSDLQWQNFQKGKRDFLYEYPIHQQKRFILDKFSKMTLNFDINFIQYLDFFVSVIHLNIFENTELKIMNEGHLWQTDYEEVGDISIVETIKTTLNSHFLFIQKWNSIGQISNMVFKEFLWKFQFAFWILQHFEEQRELLKIINKIDSIQYMEVMLIKLKYLNTLSYHLKRNDEFTLKSCKQAYNCFDFEKLSFQSESSLQYKIYHLAFICIQLNLAFYYQNFEKMLIFARKAWKVKQSVCNKQLNQKSVLFSSTYEQLSSFCNDTILWLTYYFYDQLTLNCILEQMRQSHRARCGFDHFNEKYVAKLLLNFQKQFGGSSQETISEKLSSYSQEIYQKCRNLQLQQAQQQQLKQFIYVQTQVIFQKIRFLIMNEQEEQNHQKEFKFEEFKRYLLLLNKIYKIKKWPIFQIFDFQVKALKNILRDVAIIKNFKQKVAIKYQKQLKCIIADLIQIIFTEIKIQICEQFPKYLSQILLEKQTCEQQKLIQIIRKHQSEHIVLKRSQLSNILLDLASFTVGYFYIDQKLELQLINFIEILTLVNSEMKINSLYWLSKAKYCSKYKLQQPIDILKQGIVCIQEQRLLRSVHKGLQFQADDQIFKMFNNFDSKIFILYKEIAKQQPNLQKQSQNILLFLAKYCHKNFSSLLNFLKQQTELKLSFYYMLWLSYLNQELDSKQFLQITLCICQQISVSHQAQSETGFYYLETNYMAKLFLKSLLEIFQLSNWTTFIKAKYIDGKHQQQVQNLTKQILTLIYHEKISSKLTCDILFFILVVIGVKTDSKLLTQCKIKNIVSKLRRYSGKTGIIFGIFESNDFDYLKATNKHVYKNSSSLKQHLFRMGYSINGKPYQIKNRLKRKINQYIKNIV